MGGHCSNYACDECEMPVFELRCDPCGVQFVRSVAFASSLCSDGLLYSLNIMESSDFKLCEALQSLQKEFRAVVALGSVEAPCLAVV